MRTLINEVLQKVKLENAWEVHLAAMLAPLGFLTLPPEVVLKSRAGEMLSKIEEQLLTNLPEITARLLANIPRLHGVAQLVRYQQKHFDGTGFPQDAVQGEAIPIGARLLKIFLDMMQLRTGGLGPFAALDEMRQRRGWYDPKLLAEVRACFGGDAAPSETAKPNISVTVSDLAVGMVLYSDILTRDGTLVLSAGHQISQMSLEKIQNFEQLTGIKTPIFVEIAS
jgi:HD-GYP domain-containing protein (c-di-GMP phosphodiesterase class II)